MAVRSTTPAFAFGGPPRVNLMPRVEIERRERSVLFRRWGWALLVALLVVVAIGAGAFWLQAAAQQRLAAENARTTQLLTQVAALQPVREKLTLQSELGEFRSAAMGTDLAWIGLIAVIADALPGDVAIAEYDLSPGALPLGEDPTLEVGVRGGLVLSGSEPTDVTALIRTIRGLPGVMDADGWAVLQDGDRYRYEMRITFDQSVYTGAYVAEDPE